jgi:hypothetical protein
VRSFLGISSYYYRKYIQNVSTIAAPQTIVHSVRAEQIISDCMVSVITRSTNEQSDTTTVNVNNENQGTDAHVSNTSDDGINRIITESNWIQQWTNEDLVNHQNNDDTLLRTVINLFRSNNLKSEIHSSNQELRALLRQ